LNTASLDPAYHRSETEKEIASLVFTPLVGLDRLAHPAPGAALEWQTDDNIEWTFHLDPDGRFHNGEPVTADSFIAAIAFLADSENAAPNAYLGVDARIVGFEEMFAGEADSIVGLEASDPLTLEIRLTEPNALLPSLLAQVAFAPRARAVLEDPELAAVHPIGNGPYAVLELWDGSSPISLVPVDGDGQTVRFEIFDSVESMFADRTLDVSHVPANKLEGLFRGPSKDRVLARTVGAYNYLAFPLDQPPFDSREVRRALSLAIDRELVVEQVFANGMEPAVGFAPAGSPGSTPGDCIACVFDPDRARELIEEVGGFGVDAIELAFNTDHGHEDWVQAVGAQWSEVFSIEVRFKPDGNAPYFEAIESGAHTGPYRLGWSVDYAHAMSFLEPLFVGEDNTTVGYHNTAIDEISGRLMELDDPYSEDGAAMVSLITEWLNEDMPIIPVFNQVSARLLSEAVSEVQLNLDGSVRLKDAILSR
jgi:peptide/nickel transport system substrate-binding protein/oligopeptide transport system substrate-binding protein